jgi:hypothetical protein
MQCNDFAVVKPSKSVVLGNTKPLEYKPYKPSDSPAVVQAIQDEKTCYKIQPDGTRVPVAVNQYNQEFLLAWFGDDELLPNAFRDGHIEYLLRSKFKQNLVEAFIAKQKSIPQMDENGTVRYVPNPQYKG